MTSVFANACYYNCNKGVGKIKTRQHLALLSEKNRTRKGNDNMEQLVIERDDDHVIKESNNAEEIRTRKALAPYKHKRLAFEGVLIHIIEPSKKNKFTYGLVFGSVYAFNENIEIDHAVIKMEQTVFETLNFELYKRYHFTAEIQSYYKTERIIGILAKREYFMLTKINAYKIKPLDYSHLTQPTLYVRNRIQNISVSKTIEPPHTKEELYELIEKLPNDGSIEKFIDNYTKCIQHKKLSSYDIIDALYRPDEKSIIGE